MCLSCYCSRAFFPCAYHADVLRDLFSCCCWPFRCYNDCKINFSRVRLHIFPHIRFIKRKTKNMLWEYTLLSTLSSSTLQGLLLRQRRPPWVGFPPIWCSSIYFKSSTSSVTIWCHSQKRILHRSGNPHPYPRCVLSLLIHQQCDYRYQSNHPSGHHQSRHCSYGYLLVISTSFILTLNTHIIWDMVFHFNFYCIPKKIKSKKSLYFVSGIFTLPLRRLRRLLLILNPTIQNPASFF